MVVVSRAACGGRPRRRPRHAHFPPSPGTRQPARNTRTAAILGVAVAIALSAAAVLPLQDDLPDVWTTPDAVSSLILPGYAFAQVVTLTLTAVGNLADTGQTVLDGAQGIAIFERSGTTYAAVASRDDDGVQILSLTDPANPAAVGFINDTTTLLLNGARGIAVFERSGATYAAVASRDDDGVQILNLTDPANPVHTDSIRDGSGSPELDAPQSIAIFERGGSTYAAVASFGDSGVQILNLDDPADISATDHIGHDSSSGVLLNHAYDIATWDHSGSTYAAVAAQTSDAVQILNLTDPADIAAVANVPDNGTLALNGARGIDIFERSGATYAVVAASSDRGVQVIDLSDPANPAPAGSYTGGSVFSNLYRTTAFELAGAHYAVVGANGGIRVVDLSEPDNPALAARLDSGAGLLLADANDVATFESDGSLYAAVAASTSNGVQVVQLTAAADDEPPAHAFCHHPGPPMPPTRPSPSRGRAPTTSTGATAPPTSRRLRQPGPTPMLPPTPTRSPSPAAWSGSHLNDAQPNAARLASIEQWGNSSWTSMAGAFYGAENMVYRATDKPDLSGVSSMREMFDTARMFDGDLSSWDVASVTDMSYAFPPHLLQRQHIGLGR